MALGGAAAHWPGCLWGTSTGTSTGAGSSGSWPRHALGRPGPNRRLRCGRPGPNRRLRCGRAAPAAQPQPRGPAEVADSAACFTTQVHARTCRFTLDLRPSHLEVHARAGLSLRTIAAADEPLELATRRRMVESRRLLSGRAGHPRPEAPEAPSRSPTRSRMAALWAPAQTYGRVGRPQCSLCALSKVPPKMAVAPTPQERGHGACERRGAVRAADGGEAHAVQVCRLRRAAGRGGDEPLCQRLQPWVLEAATVSPPPPCNPVCSGGGGPRREWRAG